MKVIVLNDGTTFTDAHGCVMLELPNNCTDAEVARAAFKAHALPHITGTEVARDGDAPATFNVEILARF